MFFGKTLKLFTGLNKVGKFTGKWLIFVSVLLQLFLCGLVSFLEVFMGFLEVFEWFLKFFDFIVFVIGVVLVELLYLLEFTYELLDLLVQLKQLCFILNIFNGDLLDHLGLFI